MPTKDKEKIAEYNRRYHAKNRAAQYQRVRRNKIKTVAENQGLVCVYLACHPCVDCGEGDIVVLEFDHVRGEKRRAISEMILRGYSMATIQKEIDKCDVRCANCHRRATATRTGYRRHKWSP